MVTYRIITDGMRYIVQIRNCILWLDVDKDSGLELDRSFKGWRIYNDSRALFLDLSEAEQFALNMFGKSAKRYREWRVC